MMYDDKHEPEIGFAAEFVFTWIFTIGLIAVVLFVLSMID